MISFFKNRKAKKNLRREWEVYINHPEPWGFNTTPWVTWMRDRADDLNIELK